MSEHVVDVGTDLRGGGKLGSSPGASTTKGPPQKKTVKILSEIYKFILRIQIYVFNKYKSTYKSKYRYT